MSDSGVMIGGPDDGDYSLQLTSFMPHASDSTSPPPALHIALRMNGSHPTVHTPAGTIPFDSAHGVHSVASSPSGSAASSALVLLPPPTAAPAAAPSSPRPVPPSAALERLLNFTASSATARSSAGATRPAISPPQVWTPSATPSNTSSPRPPAPSPASSDSEIAHSAGSSALAAIDAASIDADLDAALARLRQSEAEFGAAFSSHAAHRDRALERAVDTATLVADTRYVPNGIAAANHVHTAASCPAVDPASAPGALHVQQLPLHPITQRPITTREIVEPTSSAATRSSSSVHVPASILTSSKSSLEVDRPASSVEFADKFRVGDRVLDRANTRLFSTANGTNAPPAAFPSATPSLNLPFFMSARSPAAPRVRGETLLSSPSLLTAFRPTFSNHIDLIGNSSSAVATARTLFHTAAASSSPPPASTANMPSFFTAAAARPFADFGAVASSPSEEVADLFRRSRAMRGRTRTDTPEKEQQQRPTFALWDVARASANRLATSLADIQALPSLAQYIAAGAATTKRTTDTQTNSVTATAPVDTAVTAPAQVVAPASLSAAISQVIPPAREIAHPPHFYEDAADTTDAPPPTHRLDEIERQYARLRADYDDQQRRLAQQEADQRAEHHRHVAERRRALEELAARDAREQAEQNNHAQASARSSNVVRSVASSPRHSRHPSGVSQQRSVASRKSVAPSPTHKAASSPRAHSRPSHAASDMRTTSADGVAADLFDASPSPTPSARSSPASSGQSSPCMSRALSSSGEEEYRYRIEHFQASHHPPVQEWEEEVMQQALIKTKMLADTSLQPSATRSSNGEIPVAAPLDRHTAVSSSRSSRAPSLGGRSEFVSATGGHARHASMSIEETEMRGAESRFEHAAVAHIDEHTPEVRSNSHVQSIDTVQARSTAVIPVRQPPTSHLEPPRKPQTIVSGKLPLTSREVRALVRSEVLGSAADLRATYAYLPPPAIPIQLTRTQMLQQAQRRRKQQQGGAKNGPQRTIRATAPVVRKNIEAMLEEEMRRRDVAHTWAAEADDIGPADQQPQTSHEEQQEEDDHVLDFRPHHPSSPPVRTSPPRSSLRDVDRLLEDPSRLTRPTFSPPRTFAPASNPGAHLDIASFDRTASPTVPRTSPRRTILPVGDDPRGAAERTAAWPKTLRSPASTPRGDAIGAPSSNDVPASSAASAPSFTSVPVPLSAFASDADVDAHLRRIFAESRLDLAPLVPSSRSSRSGSVSVDTGSEWSLAEDASSRLIQTASVPAPRTSLLDFSVPSRLAPSEADDTTISTSSFVSSLPPSSRHSVGDMSDVSTASSVSRPGSARDITHSNDRLAPPAYASAAPATFEADLATLHHLSASALVFPSLTLAPIRSERDSQAIASTSTRSHVELRPVGVVLSPAKQA